MTEKNHKEAVVDGLRQNIRRLEEAIDDVNRVRKDLFQNAHQVKSQIHSTVSRELESLRNREVWLLTQVDLVQNVKEDVLRAQQARINKALGSAHKDMQYAEREPSGMGGDIAQDIERLDLSELKPEESPHISFQADVVGFRDSILNFGRVEAGGRSLQNAFMDSNTPSASLPKPFEDYDDVEHHMLYKTVEEVKRVKNSDASILVNIPKLNLKVDDWLLKPVKAATSGEATPTVSFPAWSTNMEDWLLPQGGRANKDKNPAPPPKHCLSRDSIQDWLQQIKQFPTAQDEEEEDFEIVDKLTISDAGDSGMEITFSSTPVLTTSTCSISPATFSQVNCSTMHTWLKDGRACPSTSKLQQDELFSQLKHTPSDTHAWLVNKDSCRGDCRQVEIEDMGSFLCMADRYMFKHLPSEQDKWLFHETKTTIEKAVPAPSTCVPCVSEVCRANELCQDYNECICSPSCGAERVSNTPTENSRWLLKPSKNSSGFPIATFSHIENMSMNLSDWLYYGVSSKPTIDGSVDNRFTGLQLVGNQSGWLMSGGPVESICNISPWTTNPCLNLHNTTGTDIWLNKPAPTTDHSDTMHTSSPFENYETFHKILGSSAWLIQYEDAMEVDDADRDSEAEKRDTSTEKMDYSKWLLHSDNQRDEVDCRIPRKMQKLQGLLQSRCPGKPGFGEWLFDKCL